MIWKFIIVLSTFAIALGGIVWYAHGRHVYTKTREEVVTIVNDDLFGTREERTWIDTFKLGMLPDDASVTVLYRSYAFIIGVSVTTIVFSSIMLRRGKRK